MNELTNPPTQTAKQNIFDFTLEELGIALESAGFQKFRAKQIYHWLYVCYEEKFDAMNNLPKDLKAYLNQNFTTQKVRITKKEQSKDGSVKYLFATDDNLTYESVFLKMKEDKWTICLSSQIGCKVGCSFCLTAKGGFVRNLSAGEIVYQALAIKKDQEIPSNKAINIVYMGMGEPLDNLTNVTQCIHILSELNGLSISVRRQTISTSGIAPKIKKLGALNLGVQLAISLHAVSDDLRTKLMPINKAYNIQSIIDEVAAFPIDSRKRVMFEYLVIDELNDGLDSAKKLIALLNKIKAKVNLIYFNPYENSPYKRPKQEKVEAFREFLLKKGLLCTIRESKGLDISAACGQLREREINQKG
ncbi:23S rRNA (adenine(2503)-C(2))-methyltransferase RlmN [Helicobacter sp. MIT 05-5294]|uniref:23S rRNA (adenine(2503)-C(2))-methyltransferase RlmN n=1 Tax=Helicobacter sp. MIT 05-5294 TaxID=1548150 RepID=UPI0010FEBF8F|nr:23S rRNA (adenine(2503)-C(2))-methyltransferase RlmN [Helicobacter sp. MIT 05-5294]TLD87261.1 23S rRNA (adenine(2503)-C(2))-methyltransferase RlmN [Helicobacter sp. MIT 05-5294]